MLATELQSGMDRRRSATERAVWLVPFFCLWAVLLNHVRAEWTVNPQYSYGWLVPFLCLGLIIRRWKGKQKAESRGQKVGNRIHWPVVLFFACIAFLWLPTRLVQEANPEWRLISWSLAFEVVALTMLAVQLAFGSAWTSRIVFPVCFFLVAVPWPTPIEAPLIQALTRASAVIVIEALGWLGVPAMAHGNVIEVATGMIGIDEACSGIRSFQSCIMISLFLGEFYRLRLSRRLLLFLSGFIFSMAFNVCRLTLLTWIAAKQGVAAISEYHDPAGVTIAIACTLALWGLALLMSRTERKGDSREQKAESGEPRKAAEPPRGEETGEIAPGKFYGSRKAEGELRNPVSAFNFHFSAFPRLVFALLVWLVFVEVGVEAWYRWHEARLPKSTLWSMAWPQDNPMFVNLVLPERTKQLLRYDEGSSVTWREADGTQWQMIYLRWLPGRIAVHLAKSHTPEVCLAAAGHSVQTNPGLDYVPVHGLRLPFRTYLIEDAGRTSYVFYCLWEDRARDQSFQTTKLTYENRLDPVVQGRRNVGQRSLEVVVRGFGSIEEAQNALARQLEKLLKIDGTAAISLRK